MSKHTQGPWHHAGYARSMAFRVTKTPDDANGDICNVLAGLAAKENGEVEANARLIAAAPDMLAALNFLNQCSAPMTGQQEECWKLVRAAIFKATGELFNTDAQRLPAGRTD